MLAVFNISAGKPSPGEAAISMIQEHRLQLQSIAILHVPLKSTNLKAMTHYPIVMVKLIQILKPSTGDQASSTILEKILKLQLMLVDQRLLKITNLESMIVYGAMLEPLMAQLSTGNQPSSMIKESLLELQSVAVDWWSLKIINLKNHGTLWCHVGKVDADRETITWGSSHKYDSGTSPSIAINDNLTVIEVHETGSSILTYHVGAVQQ